MDFARHCTEIITQTELLTADVAGADLRSVVPSCPGWTLGALIRHVGGGHRWAEETVRTRATEYLPDDFFRDVEGDDTGEVPTAWLLEGASLLAGALRAAGPDAELFAPFDYDRTSFWARRFANETVVHRADACLAAAVPFVVDTDVAGDAIDEWMELDVLPQHFEMKPEKRELLGAGRTLALEATDVDASWFVDLTGDVITWARESTPAAVTVRAPVSDLLLLIYRRLAVPSPSIRVVGDEALLDLWLGHVAFG
jgi:uncharacterized protein (TIGR03083 family)